MSFKITGLDDMQRKLQKLQDNAKAIDGKNKVPLPELFPVAFVKKHTDFASLDEMFAQSGFEMDSAEDFENIPDSDWDAFIASRTRFPSWQEMLNAGTTEWVKTKMGF